MTQFSEHDANTNGINIHYYRSSPPDGGQGRPILVMIHGLTDNGMCWVHVADALRDEYEIILPDTRGHGHSDKPETGYSVEERAADIAGLIDALGLERPVLFGHSLGGQVSTAVAALYPEKIRAVVLEDPAWVGPSDEKMAESWTSGLRQQQRMGVDGMLQQIRGSNPGWHEDELGPWAESKMQMSETALRQILLDMRWGWQDFVRKIQCPVLLVTGETDIIVHQAMFEEAASLNPRIRRANIPHAGHCIHRDQFEPFMEQVRAFLESL